MSGAPTCVVAEDEALLREALVSALRKAWPECLIVDDFRKTTKDTYFYWPEKR